MYNYIKSILEPLKLTLLMVIITAFIILVVQHYRLSEALGKAEGRVVTLEAEKALYEAEIALNREVLAQRAVELEDMRKLQTKVKVVYRDNIKENPEWANAALPESVIDSVSKYACTESGKASGEFDSGLCSVH